MQTVTDVPKLATRKSDSHKGTFGRVAVIGGKVGMSGAPALAAMGALRSGAGLVRVAVPSSILPTVAAINPCYTTVGLTEDRVGGISSRAVAAVLDLAADSDVVAFGPGVGVGSGMRWVLNTLVRHKDLRLIVDADGLNCLAKDSVWAKKKNASMILTPHPGEMQRLWSSLMRDDLPQDRIEQALRLAQRTETVVVLKGHETVVTDGRRVYVNTTGNPGMATGGTGDVLTGVIAAGIGQGLENFNAAVLGTYIHGLAGDITAELRGQISLIATDIIENLEQAFQQHA